MVSFDSSRTRSQQSQTSAPSTNTSIQQQQYQQAPYPQDQFQQSHLIGSSDTSSIPKQDGLIDSQAQQHHQGQLGQQQHHFTSAKQDNFYFENNSQLPPHQQQQPQLTPLAMKNDLSSQSSGLLEPTPGYLRSEFFTGSNTPSLYPPPYQRSASLGGPQQQELANEHFQSHSKQIMVPDLNAPSNAMFQFPLNNSSGANSNLQRNDFVSGFYPVNTAVPPLQQQQQQHQHHPHHHSHHPHHHPHTHTHPHNHHHDNNNNDNTHIPQQQQQEQQQQFQQYISQPQQVAPQMEVSQTMRYPDMYQRSYSYDTPLTTSMMVQPSSSTYNYIQPINTTGQVDQSDEMTRLQSYYKNNNIVEQFTKDDIVVLKSLLQNGEKMKWRYISSRLSTLTGRRSTSATCCKKAKELFKLPSEKNSGTLGTSLPYLIHNSWDAIVDDSLVEG